MFRRFFTASILLPLVLGGCSLGVYKVPVQQGNLVTETMLQKLQPGMTKAQVQFVMGQPLVEELTEENQWLYFYEKEKGPNNVKGYRIRVFFDEQSLFTHYEGTVKKKALPPRFKGGLLR
jgi:outer membrane protein assembly factor BamE